MQPPIFSFRCKPPCCESSCLDSLCMWLSSNHLQTLIFLLLCSCLFYFGSLLYFCSSFLLLFAPHISQLRTWLLALAPGLPGVGLRLTRCPSPRLNLRPNRRHCLLSHLRLSTSIVVATALIGQCRLIHSQISMMRPLECVHSMGKLLLHWRFQWV